MTPDAHQPRDGYAGPPAMGPAAGSTARSGAWMTEAAPAGYVGGLPRPAPAAPRPHAQAWAQEQAWPQEQARPQEQVQAAAQGRPRAQARREAEDAGIVGAIPLLAILVVVVAGVYVAWHQGSAGGAAGGAVAGAALLAGAVVRLFLPARLAGLLAVRKRVTDAVTLAAFGAGLLIAGLVLPR